MIQFHQVRHHYRADEPVLAGLSFRVAPGEVYGLIGANGAGKSTAIACLLGLLRPKRGTAAVGGVWLGSAEPFERARAAALLQDAPVDPSLTLDEHAAWLRPWHPRWNDARRRHLADRFRLPLDRPLGALSGGQKRLAAVVLALAAEPEVLVLDEPAANLDPWSRRKLLEELSTLLADRPDIAVLYSTHLLADLERLGTRAGWLSGGKLAFELSLDELSTHWRHVTMIFDGDAPSDFVLPGSLPATVRGAVVTGIARFATERDRDSFIASTPARIEANPVTLEEVFLHWQERVEAGEAVISDQ
jgi:ABC-type multidrug transport system ATPase subunit